MAYPNCRRIRDGIQTPKLHRMHWAGHIICPNLMGNDPLKRNRNLCLITREIKPLVSKNNLAQRGFDADTTDYKT